MLWKSIFLYEQLVSNFLWFKMRPYSRAYIEGINGNAGKWERSFQLSGIVFYYSLMFFPI